MQKNIKKVQTATSSQQSGEISHPQIFVQVLPHIQGYSCMLFIVPVAFRPLKRLLVDEVETSMSRGYAIMFPTQILFTSTLYEGLDEFSGLWSLTPTLIADGNAPAFPPGALMFNSKHTGVFSGWNICQK